MVEVVEIKGCFFLGICVGMQLMVMMGYEYEKILGLNWVVGDVEKIEVNDISLKVLYMGWNNFVIE